MLRVSTSFHGPDREVSTMTPRYLHAHERERRAGGSRRELRVPSRASLALVLGVLVALTACDRAKAGKDPKAAAPPPPPPTVVVTEVVQRTVPLVRDFTARTEAVPTVDVRARVAGMLEQILFKEGSEVKAGQTLFRI